MKVRIFLFALLMLVFVPSCTKSFTTITLKPCPSTGAMDQCGTLTVYENRAARSGRTIDLNVRVVNASKTHPNNEALFMLSGGPGVAATTDNGNLSLAAYIAGDRDIVLVDQRGTGRSNEVISPQTPDWSGLSPNELEETYAAWIEQVLPSLDADPRFYTTSVAMDDLDDVRQALGYDKIDIIGMSYGTTAAQYYLRQHEAHVRSVILLAGSVGNVPIWELQALNAQQALDATFTRCENDTACSTAYPNVRAEFAALMDELAEEPVTVDLESHTETITSELFAAKVEDMLRDADRAAHLPRLIHRAYTQDDWRIFATASYGNWTNQLMGYSIQCNEAWAAFSPEEVARLGQGSFLLGWNLFRANNYSLACKYLPPGVNPAGDSDQPSSQVPVLLFNGELDPVDPPANVARAKEIWPNSLSLVLTGQGHNLSEQTAAICVAQIAKQFIADASVENLTTDCLKNIQPHPFDTFE